MWAWTAGTIDSYSNPNNYSVIAYSPSGQKLGTYQINTCSNAIANQTSFTICSALATSDQYFGGRRLAVMDQLGSAGTYYPWGEAKGTTNPQDTWSYATYWRDSVSGLDYANQRYYANAYGRMMTPDPYRASGGPADPQSWNRYAYAKGDPVNLFDPNGTDASGAGDDPPPGDPNANAFTCDTGWTSDASMFGSPCGVEQVPGPYGMITLNIGAIVTAAIAQADSTAVAAAQTQPKCFAQLKYRSVYPDGITPEGKEPMTHAYIWVQDSSGMQWLLTSGSATDGSGYLRNYSFNGGTPLAIPIGGGSDPTKDGFSNGTALSSDVCAAVARMIAAAMSFPNSAYKYNWQGPNSNTFARYILSIGGFSWGAPPDSIGWGAALPGLLPGLN